MIIINVIIIMNKRQRQQPFHVRRVRMKQSIIKSNQMLQNFTLSDNNLTKFRAITEPMNHQQQSPEVKRKNTYNSLMINELDLLNSKINRLNFNHIKYAVNLSKNNRYRQAEYQMQQNGLQAIKIQAKPSFKKIIITKQSQCLCKLSNSNQKRSNNVKLKTLRGQDSPKHLLKNNSLQKYKVNSPIKSYKEGQSNRDDKDTIRIQKVEFEPIKSRKTKPQYLYEKMGMNEKEDRDRSNLVYQKRIRSYTDFIWKLLIAHNVSLDLQLPLKWTHSKLKAYVGLGNNSNMIKGLLKRRFWWSISDQYTQDCTFVWTQIKINKIYQRQQIVYQHPIRLVQPINPHTAQFWQTKSSKKLMPLLSKGMKKSEKERLTKEYSNNRKIWNNVDMKLFQNLMVQKQKKDEGEQQEIKATTYKELTEKINQNFKQITLISNIHSFNSDQAHHYYTVKPIVHNHLQNNFLLGNKKALFYNLKDFYQRLGQDPFSYIPLTFHIKAGFKDPEYKKFVNYYRSHKQLNKQCQQKQKNIWIVKPGQNSNRGNGIIVIDQVYQLDNLIKKSEKANNKNGKLSKTYIVQKYIDRPFLYNQRKFDIRHYMLITNLYGVTRAYWYEEGYIRTSSYLFEIDNFEPHIHLTNDAVQKNYPEYSKFQPFNKISYAEFQNYLNLLSDKKYNFKEQILPLMKKMAADAAKSVYLKLSSKQQMHNFQIFGLDFMIDKKFKPWLIQINTNPCLDCSSPLLDRIIPYMVQQSIKLSVDLIYPPPSHYPSLWKHNAPLINLESFKYELIFDSLSQGEALHKLYSEDGNKSKLLDIGQVGVDEYFRDDGKQIKLQDYT